MMNEKVKEKQMEMIKQENDKKQQIAKLEKIPNVKKEKRFKIPVIV